MNTVPLKTVPTADACGKPDWETVVAFPLPSTPNVVPVRLAAGSVVLLMVAPSIVALVRFAPVGNANPSSTAPDRSQP